MAEDLLIYGSYGYTGALIARTAVNRGFTPVLAGRHTEKIERQATDLGLEYRVFSLEHPSVIEQQVKSVSAVLNCAGPFSGTAQPLISACLQTGTDYLDIAGEIDVLEAIAERDSEAVSADIALLPGVGFNVVPTDCLSAYLKTQLPSATHLTLAVDGFGTFSPGTIKSIIGDLPRSGAIREDGAIHAVPAADRTREIDFGQGPKPAVTLPWGDVSTAYYATGIPNIETYATIPGIAVKGMRRMQVLTPLFGIQPIQRALQRVAEAVIDGPTADERAQSVTRVWGEVADDEGNQVSARLRTPDIYDLTAQTAVEAAQRTLEGDVPSGFQTPAVAFGPDFILEFDEIEREDAGGGITVEASENDPAHEETDHENTE
jgi:short subunit dehydrogenase-like uncharacterized protein